MKRYLDAQLKAFVVISECAKCVHFAKGCPLMMALLLMNEEKHPGLDIIVPNMDEKCRMFFPWRTEDSRKPMRQFPRG